MGEQARRGHGSERGEQFLSPLPHVSPGVSPAAAAKAAKYGEFPPRPPSAQAAASAAPPLPHPCPRSHSVLLTGALKACAGRPCPQNQRGMLRAPSAVPRPSPRPPSSQVPLALEVSWEPPGHSKLEVGATSLREPLLCLGLEEARLASRGGGLLES